MMIHFERRQAPQTLNNENRTLEEYAPDVSSSLKEYKKVSSPESLSPSVLVFRRTSGTVDSVSAVGFFSGNGRDDSGLGPSSHSTHVGEAVGGVTTILTVRVSVDTQASAFWSSHSTHVGAVVGLLPGFLPSVPSVSVDDASVD